MTLQERYIEKQKASGIEVGDTVRITRPNEDGEGGSSCAFHEADEICGENNTGKVAEIREAEIVVRTDGGERFLMPYFVLEIVKKHDGAVPQAIAETITGDSTMKNGRFDIEIVKEKTDDKGKTTNGIVVKRYSKWHKDAVAATEYAKMKHGIAILEQKEAGFEVDILVHPFRQA